MPDKDHNGFEEIQANINYAIDTFVTTREEMRFVHAADRMQIAQSESVLVLSAILHYKTHGDYRPLGRVICDVKPNKKAIRAIRMTCPGIVKIGKLDKKDNNSFAVAMADGFNSHEDSGFFNQDHIDWWTATNTVAKRDSLSPYSEKESGWDSRFPDVAPKDLAKVKKSLTSALSKKVSDLRKRGQALTQEEMIECVRAAYADQSQAVAVVDASTGEPAH